MTAANDDEPGDYWDNLVKTLADFKRSLESLEPSLARKLRTGQHGDIADALGVAPQELDDAFLPDEDEPESTLMRRLRTGEQ